MAYGLPTQSSHLHIFPLIMSNRTPKAAGGIKEYSALVMIYIRDKTKVVKINLS